ncbi:hypothetical protein M9435_006802 [Picochlorum sp. BPE23]|nr:hypothetical protein M9435_006802 [Picochlorum sp. BPE23]
MAEEEVDLVPRKRSRSSVSSNDVPMNMRDCLWPRKNISNAQTSTMSAEPGVLAGDREQVRQCQPPTGSARAAVLQDVTNMGTDTRPIIPKEPDTATTTNEVFGNLGPFVDRRLRESGVEHGLTGFIDTLRRLSREYHQHANVEEEVLSAREASERYFSNEEHSSADDLRNLYAIWDYCREKLSSDTIKPEDMDAHRIKLPEIGLSDEDLQTHLPIEVALLALLSCSFDGGLEEMFKVFLALYSENNSGALVECVEALIPDDTRHLWTLVPWQEDCVPIPDEFADVIFPKENMHMLQYTSEGLAMSVEKIACALLHFDAIMFSMDARGWGVLFCSHVLIRANAEEKRHVLAEDFFFNGIPLGYKSNKVYVTAEGRCIANVSNAAFLTPVNSDGMLGVKFAANGSEKRWYSLWSVSAMAKYNLPVEEFECLLSGGDISSDHLTMNHAYNQPSLVQLTTWKQQTANKRPRDRETFLSESVADSPLFVPFDELEQEKKDIALACKEKQDEGLAMARLEGGDIPRQIYRWFKDAEGEEELWVDLEVSDSEMFFEVQKCIWRPDGDTWLFLDQPLKTTRQQDYRRMAVARSMCFIHTAISHTRLYHQVMNTGSTVIEEENSLGEVARPVSDGVQIKMLWKDGGCVRRLVTDHIDQDKGNNDPANLRLLCNRTNTIAARGSPVMMLVRPFGDAQSLAKDSILIEQQCAEDAVDPLMKAMHDLGYPEGYQQNSKETFLRWIYSLGAYLPKCLKFKIEFIPINNGDSYDNGEEDEEDDDDQEEGQREEVHRFKAWYGYKYRDCQSGECFEDLLMGKLSLAKMLQASFGVQMTVGQIYDTLSKSVLHPDKEKRRLSIALELGRKQSPRQRYVMIDIYPLFGSVRSNNVFEVVLKASTHICRGLWHVVACLEQDEGLMERLRAHVQQEETPTSKWIYGLVRSYFRNANGNSLLHQEGICITRKTPHRNLIVTSEKYSLLFNDHEKRIEMNAREIKQMLLDQGFGCVPLGTVHSWLAQALGSTGIHKNLRRLGICDVQRRIAIEEDGRKKVNRNVILKYTSKADGSVMSESFDSVQAANRFAFESLNFRLQYLTTSSLMIDLARNNKILENDLYIDVSLDYQKATRHGAVRSLYAIVSMTDDFDLLQTERLAKSVSRTLPDFIGDNADFIDQNLLKEGSNTVAEIRQRLDRGEYACLEFAGYSRSNGNGQNCLSEYLKARGVSDADRKIEIMQKRALYYQSPLGLDVPWCHHVFTRALLENAMKKNAMKISNGTREENISFMARAYLLKHSRKFNKEEERTALETDLNKFLLHKLQGGEAVQGLQIVKEELGSSGWMNLEYPSNESGNPKDRPRNRMIQDMMSKLGLKPVYRPRKQNGFHTRTVMKRRMYFDADRDIEEIPFSYKWIPEWNSYFLLVAITK